MTSFFLSILPSALPSLILLLPSLSFYLVWGLNHQAGTVTLNYIVSRSPYRLF